MSGALTGKVALVTGGGRGIGRGIALRLARDGADIALVDLGPDGINAVADEIAEIGSKATTFTADVSDRGQVFAAVDHATSALGGFDILVNNAGIALVAPIVDTKPEDVARIWAVNVDGVLWGIQAAVAKLKELGRPGKIINASSIAGHDGFAMLGGLQRDQVRGPGVDAGRRQGARRRRHHRERLLPWRRRHRHVGGDRQAVRRTDRCRRR